MSIILTNAQAIDILNRLDRADDNSVLLYVVGGIDGLLASGAVMDELKKADDGIVEIIINNTNFYNGMMNRLHQWETKEYGPLLV